MMLWAIKSHAQYFSFSEEPDKFVNDVVAGMSNIGIESADKVAYDFRNIWSSRLSPEQKTIIISTAKKMRRERLQTRPYYQYYFSLVTYAVTQANLDSQGLTNVLKITEGTVDAYSHRKLDQYLRTMSTFFARGALYTSRYNSLKFSGGSYTFELLAEPKSFLEKIEEQEEQVEEPLDETVTEEELEASEEEAEDVWGDDDGWDDSDDWGDDDGWGDEDDDWGNDDGWGSDEGDSWGNEPEEEPVLERPSYERPHVDISVVDKVAEFQSTDIAPPISGAIVKLNNVDLLMTTPFDTVEIKNTSGTFMINEEIFVGEGGVFDWPNSLKGTEGAQVVLKKYHFKTSVPYVKTSRAKMVFPRLFSDSLDGAFIFRSRRRKNNNNRSYPYFISNYSKTELKLPSQNLSYKGGFAMKGDKMFGTSISEHPSVIEVQAGNGRRFRTEAVKFAFEDSLITSKRVYQAIFHGSDSIVHPGVQFSYDTSSEHLTLLKDRGDYKNTNYFSSYFRMDFKADLIKWDINADSLDISIMNGRNIIPAVFESEEYFNPIRYDKLTGLFGFHPIVAVVQYARKINDSNFNVSELFQFYNKVEPKLLQSAMLYLKQNQYIEYQEITGDIRVLRKAYHNILSYSKKKDYDNILISSLSPNEPNASLNFETGEMTVRGVKRIFLTPDNKNVITPHEEQVTLLKNKDMRFDGSVVSGGFKYTGKEFDFDYNAFLINMAQVDSIRIEVEVTDSLNADHHEKVALHNQITETSGILYVNHPKNKAGLKHFEKYPYFVSDSDAVVYFDSPEILNGAYDRTVKFMIPPFEVDSLARQDLTGVGFEGTFISGDIFPEFKEKLVIMPDKSLGFDHKIPEDGYALYGGEGVVYNDLKLSYDGLRVNGKIDYRTTTVNSDDFIFYMDSVSAVGDQGVIREGDYKGASYPQAVLGPYKMKWLPKKDSMYIANIGEPFQFYNATASLDGEANITAKGVFGSGVMLSRGSRSESNAYEFSQYAYSARHAKFEILTDVEDKPAMAGDDISLNFDLVKNIADVHPEQEGVAAISFPYAQMKTSITNAIWHLDSAKITMSKPADVDIKSSYFYTTREELDSLAFSATDAIYDINTYELNIKGIPYIIVADAEIIPDNNETTILENSELQPFENASLKIDTLNEFHHLTNGNIKILSRNKFEGNAMYQLVTAAKDTFNIKFESFDLMDIPITTGKKPTTKKMTVSGGSVAESEKVQIAPGFLFKGEVTMYADRRGLELNGLVKLGLKSVPDYDYWLQYYNSGDSAEVVIDVATTQTEDGLPIDAGLLYDNIDYSIYPLFVNNKNRVEDEYIFKADGLITHNFEKQTYQIEPAAKSSGESYAGQTFIYDDKTKNVIFEGLLDFTKNSENFSVETSGLGVGKPDSAKYFIDAFMMFNMNIHPSIRDAFTLDVLDIIERLGADVAHENSIELIYKLSSLVGDETAKKYEDNSLRDYVPLVGISPVLDKTVVLSNVDLKWNEEHRAWYNVSNLGLANIGSTDVNAAMTGFLELKKNDTGGDVVNLFLQVAPTTWYHFMYDDNRLFMYSSNEDFNTAVSENSNLAKAGFGQFVTGLGEEVETVDFINAFRKNYFGIDEPYDLEFPQDINLESEESFQTIEKVEEKPEPYTEKEEEDDGF